MLENIPTITPQPDGFGYALKVQRSCGCIANLFYALKESAERDQKRLPHTPCSAHRTD